MPSQIGTLIKKVWQHPLTRGIDIDDGIRTLEVHRQLIRSKPLLRHQYLRWYRECLPAFEETKHLGGDLVEIGCGAGFLEDFMPGLVKTDVVANPFASKVVDAMKLDFPDESLRTVFLLGVLHHIPFPRRFFAEAQRCLKPGGRIVMMEPTNNFVERFLTRYLDHYEYFDDAVEDWVNVSRNRMSQANLALPWVIFIRDRARFEKEFPLLKINAIRYHTFLSYVVSGGMTYRSFLPSFATPLVDLIEYLTRPFMKNIGTMMTIDLAKSK